MTRVLFPSMFVLLLVTGAWHEAQAQGELDRSRLGTAAYYNYASPGDLTVQAQVFGTVRFPGLYEVVRGTTYSELLALAGGPQMTERLRRNRRTISVELFRFTGSRRTLVKSSEASRGIDVTGDDPEIFAGDVMVVETIVRQGMSWRDIFPIVSAIASVALIADRVSN